MDGTALIKALLEHTGLPQESLGAELDRLIQKAGKNKEMLSLEDIRMILEEYVHHVLPEAQKSLRTGS